MSAGSSLESMTVDVDDRLGRQVRDTRRSDVVQVENAIAEPTSNAVGELIELRRP
jgi:hypothetical protein